MKRKRYSSSITKFLGKKTKIHITKYKIAYFELSINNFPIPLLLTYYMDNYAYVLVKNGRAQISISGYDYDLCENSIVSLIPTHTAQFSEVDEDFNAIGLVLTPEFYNVVPTMEKVFRHLNRNLKLFNCPVMKLDNKEFLTLHNSLLDVHSRIEDVNHLMQRELIQNTFTKFMFEWINCFDIHILRGSPPDVGSSQADQILNNFLVLLKENYREQHLVPFYADKLCISSQYLTLIVKNLTGKTISQFIYDILYSEACILLNRTNLSIQQITDELHFSDASAFCKFFKRRSGISPLKFRNK